MLTPWLTKCKHLLFDAALAGLEDRICIISKRVRVGQDLTQLAVIILCGDSAGFDDVDDYFASEADKMIDVVNKVDLNKD